jgi:hypothetical protein
MNAIVTIKLCYNLRFAQICLVTQLARYETKKPLVENCSKDVHFFFYCCLLLLILIHSVTFLTYKLMFSSRR